jgi:uncharacterized membrane protein
MQKLFTTKRLCRAAVIAALYAVIAIVQPYSSSPIQCRLSEAFTILPLFFPEAVTGLFIGCFLANVMNGAADMLLGSFATLLAALCTYFIGRAIKGETKLGAGVRLVLGELAPVVINALLVPVVFILDGSLETAYIVEVAFMAAGEAIAVGVFGTALYFSISALRKKGVRVFCDNSTAKTKGGNNEESEKISTPTQAEKTPD